LYPPLFYVVSGLAFREGLLTNQVVLVSLVVAGLFHAVDVYHHLARIRAALKR